MRRGWGWVDLTTDNRSIQKPKGFLPLIFDGCNTAKPPVSAAKTPYRAQFWLAEVLSASHFGPRCNSNMHAARNGDRIVV